MSNNSRNNLSANLDFNMLLTYVCTVYPCNQKQALNIIKNAISNIKQEQQATYSSIYDMSDNIAGLSKAAGM